MQIESDKPKRRLSLTKPKPNGVERARASLVGRGQREMASLVGATSLDRALKSTVSLCPTCLKHVPALVFERGGKVWLTRRCEEHGSIEALLESDARYYFLSNKDRTGECFAPDRVYDIPEWSSGACCGPGESCGTDQIANRTCTVLVEVTDDCNLACPVCYADAKGTHYLPLDEFKARIRSLIEKKGGLDSVQVTGGESALHPRFWDMVEFLHGEPGVKKVYVPTNGLLFAKEENALRAARYADKLLLLLQFDAVSRDANMALRAADARKVRSRVIARMNALGVPMQLTMTLSKGINDGEVGEVIDVGLANDNVKLVAMQPATWSGRYDAAMDPTSRLTLSDVAKAVLEQANVRMREKDFAPIPCSHPNCGWITVFLRRFGVTHNVVRYVDMKRVMDRVAYKTLLSTDELRDVVGTNDKGVLERALGFLGQRLVRSTDMFSIAIKPFMDRYSYDQDRIANCCHHTMDTRGNLLSFCEYNAIGRAQDSWERFPSRDLV